MKIYKVIKFFSLSVHQVKFYTLISVFIAMIDKKALNRIHMKIVKLQLKFMLKLQNNRYINFN